jgi:hypothetical protein
MLLLLLMLSLSTPLMLPRVGTSVTLVNNGNLQMTLPDGVAVGPNAVVTSNPSRGDDPGKSEVLGPVTGVIGSLDHCTPALL